MRALFAITFLCILAWIYAATLETYTPFTNNCEGIASRWTVITAAPGTCFESTKDQYQKYTCENGTLVHYLYGGDSTCADSPTVQKRTFKEGECVCTYQSSIIGCTIARCTDPEIPKEARITTHYKSTSCDETKKYDTFTVSIHACSSMYSAVNGTGTWSCKDNLMKNGCKSSSCNECENEFPMNRGSCQSNPFSGESFKELCKGYDAASSLSANIVLVLGMLVFAFVSYL